VDTTARAIVQHIVPLWGVQFSLYSDKAPLFLSALFAHVNALLGIRHVTSASRTARSNGQAEALVKRLSEHLKFYAKDDYTIEEVIPLIEVNLRATPHSKLLISPYEIVFGRPMRIGVPRDLATAQQATEETADPHTKQSADSSASEGIQTDTKSARTDPTGYYKWLSTELKRVQDAVKLNREKVKVDDKIKYDRAHKAIAPTWKVGDRFLLSE